ncbi:hypothetical protein [Paenibacillus methanolicus]|uniref:ABC-2 family transporter n=1 Tax=Paenibacillus methanolicus TaxID=582686 RepID=A0A5S5BZU1_9BACL|nr:hypothetical protein [Paenibacillus methanolicus]TYP72459.1 hypothetical protein BCM02_108113 [Paenibacillus methanolicus]
MNRYLKLVHMEIHRFRYILAALLGLVAVVQWGALVWSARRMDAALDEVEKFGRYTMYINELSDRKISYAEAIYNAQQLYILSVLAVIGTLCAYLLFVWYRDWLGRSTFIYRLLMLPSARSSIYLSKLTAIVVFIIASLAFQALSLAIGGVIFEVLIRGDRQGESYFVDIVNATLVLQYLMPLRLGDFALNYGLGIVAVLVVFTGILIERSYRWTGIAYAVGYVLICAAAIVIPINVMGMYRTSSYLYTAEIVGIELAIILFVAAVSIWLGFRLLRRKISV